MHYSLAFHLKIPRIEHGKNSLNFHFSILLIYPHMVTVRFGEPIFPSRASSDDPNLVDTEILRNAVASLMIED